MYSCSCLLERAWRFGMPLVLAFLPGGFQAIAILGFAAPLACTLAGPAVRLPALLLLLLRHPNARDVQTLDPFRP